jgi:hypothetical protein
LRITERTLYDTATTRQRCVDPWVGQQASQEMELQGFHPVHSIEHVAIVETK